MSTLSLVSNQIENYSEEHSTLPSVYCEELAAYTQAHVPYSVMLSGPLVGSFLGFLVRHTRAKRILEVGTYTGYSALAMAERLPDDGELITLDIDATTNKVAREFWSKSPHGKKIHSILGDALASLAAISGPFDLVFIDADKANYLKYFERALPLLSDGGVIIADNCLWSGRVADPSNKESDTEAIRRFNDSVSRIPGLETMLLPLRDGLMIVKKIAS